MKTHKSVSKLLFVLFLLILTVSYPQQTSISEFQYLSPFPGSTLNSPETNIIIRYGTPYKTDNVLNKNILAVIGDKSGFHSGEIILAENNRTLLFEPHIPFHEGEIVNVKIISQIRTNNYEIIPGLDFSFRITENVISDIVRNQLQEELFNEYHQFKNSTYNNELKSDFNRHIYSVMDDSLPVDFPDIEVDSLSNPATGFIFLAPYNFINSDLNNYLTILDNHGVPVFYRQFYSSLFDFKKQESGVLTYFHSPGKKFYVLDSSYTLTDSLYMKNGYYTDLHELLVLSNDHYLMMSYDFKRVAMDTVVPGGDPDAWVAGLIIQEQDENKNVVFQWRSWDHFKITDATYEIDLTNAVVDYVHGNAIEVDDDNNLLISSRHMDEVTKIDRQSGEIIWRWGGEHCENNQFTFISDPIGFSHQHDIRRLDNGNLTLFDNGNLHSPQFSRVAEYQLDEVNKLAFLVWDYRNDPMTYSYAMGSARRLPNHNTIVGWGSATSPAVSEVKHDGKVALLLSLPDTLYSYRAFKFPWKTNLFIGNPDSLIFGYIPVGDSLELNLELINNSDQQIEINSIYNRNSAYTVLNPLPITLAPLGMDTIRVKFKPETDKDYFDDLHLRWDTEGQRIAQVIPLIGSTDSNFVSVEDEEIPKDFYLSQNYPNPFNPVTSIQYAVSSRQFVTLKVYDILGREVATLVNEEKSEGKYEVEFSTGHSGEVRNLTSGIYFYRLQTGNFIETKKMILMK